MKAWQISRYAHPSKLNITTHAPDPSPKPDEVIVEVYSAALNFFE